MSVTVYTAYIKGTGFKCCSGTQQSAYIKGWDSNYLVFQ